MENSTQVIHEFVSLYVDRRRGNLPVAKQHRLDTLEDVLRDTLDGAHTAPRKIDNPSAVEKSDLPQSIAPAKIKIQKRAMDATPSFGPSEPPGSVPSPPAIKPEIPINLSEADEKKITSIDRDNIPSGYTPTANPCFLSDYYNTDFSLLSSVPQETPTTIRSASNEGNVNMHSEAKILLGLQNAQIEDAAPIALDPSALQAIKPEPVAPAPQQAPAPSQAAVGPPTRSVISFGPSEPPSKSVDPPSQAATNAHTIIATVHLISGGSKHGSMKAFDPTQPTLSLSSQQGTETIGLRNVLAIFFQESDAIANANGRRVVVTLINDRELAGISSDYAPGIAAMHLVPENNQGQTSQIWVPAWAVKAVRYA